MAIEIRHNFFPM